MFVQDLGKDLKSARVWKSAGVKVTDCARKWLGREIMKIWGPRVLLGADIIWIFKFPEFFRFSNHIWHHQCHQLYIIIIIIHGDMPCHAPSCHVIYTPLKTLSYATDPDSSQTTHCPMPLTPTAHKPHIVLCHWPRQLTNHTLSYATNPNSSQTTHCPMPLTPKAHKPHIVLCHWPWQLTNHTLSYATDPNSSQTTHCPMPLTPTYLQPQPHTGCAIMDAHSYNARSYSCCIFTMCAVVV